MRNLLLMTLGFSFAGCAYNIKVPSSRMITSESNGGLLKSTMGMSSVGATDVSIGISPTRINNHVDTKSSQDAVASVSIGILERLDLIGGAGFKSADAGGVKFQLLGKPRIEAKKGDSSLSVAALYGKKTQNDVDDDIFDIAGNTKVNIQEELVEGDILFGHRLMDQLLTYGVVSYSSYNFNGQVHSDQTAINGGSFSFDGKIWKYGLGCTYYTSDKVYFQLEAALQQSDWTNSIKHRYGYLNAMVGVAF